MSVDRTRPVQRGLLVHDPRITLDTSHPGHTWESVGPRPGVPEDQGDPRSLLVLRASGSQSGSSRLRVRAIRSGFAGLPARAGAYVYRDEADTDWRGWDVPTALCGWEWLQYTEGPSLAPVTQPHLLRLQDGRVLLAARVGGTPAPVITVRRYDPATGVWTSLATVSPPVSPVPGAVYEQVASHAWPSLVQLPGGRVLLFSWVGTVDYTQLSMWYSDDAGATWTRGERWCLASSLEDLGVAPSGKMRIAYNNGQLLLVASVTDGTDRLTQWASDDLGARFHHVTTFGVAVATGPEIVTQGGGGYVVLWVDPDVSEVYGARIGSAWHTLSEAGATQVPMPSDIDEEVEEICAWRGEDGAWYLIATHAESVPGGRAWVLRSLDDGASWPVRERLGVLWPEDSGEQRIHGMAATETQGRTIIATRFTTEANSPDIAPYSMLCLYAGGHTTVTMPSSVHGRREADQARWEVVWIATEPPPSWTGWSEATSGSANATIEADGMEVQATASSMRTYTYSAVSTGAGYESVAEMIVTVTSLPLGGYVGLATWAGDAASGYGAEVRVTGSSIGLVSPGTGAALSGAVSVLLVGSTVQVRLAVSQGSARWWYRVLDAYGDIEHEWIPGPPGAPPVSTGDPDLGHVRVRVAAGPLPAVAHLRMVAGLGLEPALGLAAGPTYPDELFPRSFSPLPVTLPGGVALSATDGPALIGDTWHVDPRYEYPAEAVDPMRYPSPRRVARTVASGTREMVYRIGPLAATDARLDTSSWGVGIYGADTCDVQLHGWDGLQWVPLTSGSSWVDGLAYVRVGDAVMPDPQEVSPATDPLYVERDMLAGAVIDLGDAVLRRIASNTEGWWGPGPSRPPVLYLDPDHLAGAPPTSGTCRVGPGERGQVIIVHGLDAYQYLRVTYGLGWGGARIQVGTVVVGPVVLWGRPYSWGRTLTLAPQVSVAQTRDGTRRTRVDGPPRRAVEIGWSEGVHDRQLWAGAAPDYVRGGPSGEPVAVVADVGSMLEGLVRQLQGPHRPVVYLPAVPSDATEVRLLWPSQHMLGRIVGDLRREAYLGDERAGEVERIASVRIEEEV